MTKFLKQNWFVVVIAAFFLVISVYFAIDTNKNSLPSKTVGGKDIVYSVDGTDVTADEYFEHLNVASGENYTFLKFYETVLDLEVANTTEILTEISNNYTSTLSYYQTYYGYGEDYLNQLASYYYGYPTFLEYVTYSIKAEKLYSSYIEANVDKYYTSEFVAKHNPRTISYVLIKWADPKNPTADDQERFEKAKTAWASNDYTVENFAEFAKNFSEDSSTKDSGGVLGYVDDNSSLVEAFLETALKLKAGEVSEWVFDENYGMFLIKCDSTDYNDFKSDANFISTVLSENENLSNQVVWEAAKKRGVTFANDDIKASILSMLGVESED